MAKDTEPEEVGATDVTFSGSNYVRELHVDADPEDVRHALRSLLHAAGAGADVELLSFMASRRSRHQLVNIKGEVERLRQLPASSNLAASLKLFLATRSIVRCLPGSPYDEGSAYPSGLERILERGADALYGYGRTQLQKLRSTCELIVERLGRSFQKVILIESPVGNLVPVQVLTAIAERETLDWKVLRLSAPRNEKPRRGITPRAAIDAMLAKVPLNTDAIVYIDDVLTGSRFRKLHGGVKKGIGCASLSAVLVSCALAFTPHSFELTPEQNADRRSLLKRLMSEAAADMRELAWVEFPQLPRIKIDDGPPVAYESPVVWGEDGFVAGVER